MLLCRSSFQQLAPAAVWLAKVSPGAAVLTVAVYVHVCVYFRYPLASSSRKRQKQSPFLLLTTITCVRVCKCVCAVPAAFVLQVMIKLGHADTSKGRKTGTPFNDTPFAYCEVNTTVQVL
eukprot:16496-Heterococcus_DN1.PRE.5